MSNTKLNILLAEDNPDDVALMRVALRKAGVMADLQVAKDGTEAVEFLNGDGKFEDRQTYPLPDLLLLDLNMPGCNGFEVLEWVRNNEVHKHLIVHVLTSSCRAVDVERCYDLHANSFVVKPSRLDELTLFVVGLINWHRFVCLPASRANCSSIQ